MKKIFTLLTFFFFTHLVFSQPFENSWISYSQPYYKIKIAQNGIYRIGQSALIFSSIPITSINHRRLQLWHNGQEEYIYVFDQNQNDTIDAGDYIEFYGEKNDGTFDTRLYANPQWQPNSRYSLINDTSVYFLTWNSSLANRRMTVTSDTTYSSYTAAPYFIKEAYEEETSTYITGRSTSFGGTDIDYIEAEGWMGPRSTAISKTVNMTNLVASGPAVEINTSLAGSNNNLHNLQITSTGISFSDVFSGYVMKHYSFSVPASSYGATANFTYTSDNITFSSLAVKYPHSYDMENASGFYLHVPDASGQGKTRMDISNFNAAGTVLLYDLTNHRRIAVTQNGSLYQALVDNDGGAQPKRCFLAGGSQIRNIGGLTAVGYIPTQPGHFTNFMSLQTDSAYLIVTHKNLWGEALSYKSYRDGTTGNKVVIADINELYDQFAYGIVKHPLAIKNYVKYILGNWPGAVPEHLFLIGKALHSTTFRNNASAFAACLVPAFGEPASDIPYTSGLNGTLYEPMVPTGRLPATSGAQVLNYLGKVQEYEAAQNGPPQAWMKEILHFVGGSSSGQQDILENYMKNYESFLEDTSFGGNVTTYEKNSSAPIVINQSDSLQARIDSGVSIMTFFGHASGAGFDVSTDVPSEFNNKGRYHFVMANSCFAGDIHTPTPSVSEQYVMEPYKAAIAFLASVGLGESYYLNLYATQFFKNVSQTMYGQSIGKIMKRAIATIEDSTDLGVKTVCYEMSLDGDPAVKVNFSTLPDLEVAEPSIYFSPSNITSELDSFTVHAIVRNIGKATGESFNVVITRTYPDGADSVFTLFRPYCYYADTIALKIANGGFNSVGLNRFKVEVDLDSNRVAELDDIGNNSATTALFITSSDIVPVYPYKYSIVGTSNVTFKANTSNPFSSTRAYKFELDTADFSVPGYTPSSFYRFATVNGAGGVIAWSNTITLQDSLVYYWRVADDSVSVNPIKFKWNQSSFTYIPGQSGWSQAHFHQFKEDDYTALRYDTVARKTDFIVNNASLTALNYGAPWPVITISQLNETGYSLNNAVGDYAVCNVNPSVMVAVIDSITLQPWTTVDHPNSGSYNFYNPTNQTGNCRLRPEYYFIFRFDNSCPDCLDSLGTFLASVPAGNYILAYSVFPTNYSAYPKFTSALTNVGFNFASVIPDNYPFMFFMERGFPATMQQLIGDHPNDTLRLNALLSSVWDRGTVTSETIGPSTNWTSLHWRQHTVETGSSRDSVALNIIGIRSDGTVDTLKTGIQPTTTDTTLSWISAGTWPYLRLQAYLKDDSLRTPPQMDKWQVYYTDVPEAALNANRSFLFHANPLSEGDTLRLQVAIDNIGDLPMDSLGVDFYMYDNNRVRRNLKSAKLDSLRVNQYLIAGVTMDSTFGLAGQNSLWVEVNPFNAMHQLEKYHFNNLAEIRFNIERDIMNPILDVTFDGIHILNGDVVSGKPNIAVQLHDENKFLALNDTSKFKVYIKAPGANDFERIYFSSLLYSAALRFTPAVLPKNSARIDYNPTLLTDGTYEFQVEAADISNNESGKFNYTISFEVINKSTITEVLNYPNPFSTSTRFVFTLTGNETPTQMKIQIVTVSGKIVREILQNELGNIHIGRNITDYAWDGKDEYGDQLANGLYLYRVITNINGEAIEKRSTEADKFFKKGWGKMYLMR